MSDKYDAEVVGKYDLQVFTESILVDSVEFIQNFVQSSTHIESGQDFTNLIWSIIHRIAAEKMLTDV